MLHGGRRLNRWEVRSRAEGYSWPEELAWNKEEVIVQLNGVGPWGVTYVNPADDPRKK